MSVTVATGPRLGFQVGVGLADRIHLGQARLKRCPLNHHLHAVVRLSLRTAADSFFSSSIFIQLSLCCVAQARHESWIPSSVLHVMEGGDCNFSSLVS